MGRLSTKQNKSYLQISRENLGLSREKASELLETISADRIEKIENEKVNPYPEEILLLSEKYKDPTLINTHCSTQCPIGKRYISKVEMKDFSQIVLEVLSSLNSMQKKKDDLIDLASDGKITEDEIRDFILIHKELSRISLAIESLKLWQETMLQTGKIDKLMYEKIWKEELGSIE